MFCVMVLNHNCDTEGMALQGVALPTNLQAASKSEHIPAAPGVPNHISTQVLPWPYIAEIQGSNCNWFIQHGMATGMAAGTTS